MQSSLDKLRCRALKGNKQQTITKNKKPTTTHNTIKVKLTVVSDEWMTG